MSDNLVFHQLYEKETSTYTYLLADKESKEAILIDPVIEMVQRDMSLVNELGLKLKYILDTHVHADHVTASGEIRKRTGAKVGVSSAYDLACADLHLNDGQELQFGKHTIKILHTPGHTSGCLSYQIDNMVFTGDALLIRGCGRTDFQEGSADKLFHSVRDKIFNLPDDTIIYPGHDYKGFTSSSVGIEKRLNPRLNLEIPKEKFIDIMANLKLAFPRMIEEAVPANQKCGLLQKSEMFKTTFVDGVLTVRPEEFHSKIGHVKIIDVRGEDEYNYELGHITNSILATLGPVLDKKLDEIDRDTEIVFVCRSGKRSAEATKMALHKGFNKVYNLQGGMLRWHELNLPFERDQGGS